MIDKPNKFFVIATIVVAAGMPALVGCDRNSESEDEGAAEGPAFEAPYNDFDVPFPRNDWACTDDKIERTQEWVESHSELLALPRRTPETSRVRAEPSELDLRFSIAVGPEEVRITDSGSVGSPASIVESPDLFHHQLQERWELGIEEIETTAVGVVIDNDTPGEMIAGVLAEIATALGPYAGMPFLVALFETESSGVEPVPEEVVAESEAWMPTGDETDGSLPRFDQRAALDAREEAIGDCSEIVEMFEERQLEEVDHHRRADVMNEVYLEGYRACECDADIETLLAHFMLPEPGSYAVAVPLVHALDKWFLVVDESEREVVKIDDELTWEQIAPEELGDVPEVTDMGSEPIERFIPDEYRDRSRSRGMPLPPRGHREPRDHFAGSEFILADLSVQGAQDPEIVERIARQNRRQIQHCHEHRRHHTDSDLEGLLTIRWTVTPGGEVKEVSVGGSTIDDEELQECVTRRIGQWTFVEADGSAEIEVTFEFGAAIP